MMCTGRETWEEKHENKKGKKGRKKENEKEDKTTLSPPAMGDGTETAAEAQEQSHGGAPTQPLDIYTGLLAAVLMRMPVPDSLTDGEGLSIPRIGT
jgi:hypothetical protein